jgi:hypothetical protein
MLVAFTPAGVWTLMMAFTVNNPQIFVMLVFSGSMMVLLGLTGALGAWFRRPGRREEKSEMRGEEQ